MKTMWPKFFGVIFTFILAFLIATNISSYQNSEVIEEVRQSAIQQIENNPYLADSNEQSKSFRESYILELNDTLTVKKYEKSSLHRIVGNIIAFLGLMLIRFRKSIGLHFVIGGIGFVVFSGFFIFGVSIVGWAINIGYIILLGMLLLYYYAIKKYEANLDQ